MEKRKKEKSDGPAWLAFMKRDMLYLICICLCLVGVAYDLMTIDKYVSKADENCNNHIAKYCVCGDEYIRAIPGLTGMGVNLTDENQGPD